MKYPMQESSIVEFKLEIPKNEQIVDFVFYLSLNTYHLSLKETWHATSLYSFLALRK